MELEEKKIAKEIYIAQKLKIENINVPKYEKCYKDIKENRKDCIVIQYEGIFDSIATSNNDLKNIIDKAKM